jgi:hypothetical protein
MCARPSWSWWPRPSSWYGVGFCFHEHPCFCVSCLFSFLSNLFFFRFGAFVFDAALYFVFGLLPLESLNQCGCTNILLKFPNSLSMLRCFHSRPNLCFFQELLKDRIAETTLENESITTENRAAVRAKEELVVQVRMGRERKRLCD